MTAPRPTREQAQRPSTQRAIRAEAESMPNTGSTASATATISVDEVCGLLAEKGTELGGLWSDHLDGPVWELRLRLRGVTLHAPHHLDVEVEDRTDTDRDGPRRPG
jgi:hypothetical protein